MGKVMEIVGTGELTTEDLGWLIKAVPENVYGWTPSMILDQIRVGTTLFWRFNSPVQGCMLTAVGKCPKGEYLYLTWTAGKGYIRAFAEIAEVLKDHARTKGYFAIAGEFKRRGLEKVYSAAGAEFDSNNFIFKLEN